MADPKVVVKDPTATDAIQFAKLVGQTLGRNSITRMANTSISQWPMIVSSAIPIEDQVVLAKAYEAFYASLLMSVISMNSEFDRDVYSNPSQYLTKFYQNKNIPTIILAGIESTNTMDESVGPYVFESAQIVYGYDALISKEKVMECWDCPMDRFNADSINSIYTPSEIGQKAIENFVNRVREKTYSPAMEADDNYRWLKTGNHIDSDNAGIPGRTNRKTEIIKNAPLYNEDGRPIFDDKGRQARGDIRKDDSTVEGPRTTAKQEFVSTNATLSSLQPTLINVQLISHDKGGATITHNVVIGVKTMIRNVSSDLMVSNLVEGINKSHGKMFSMIQWSNGTKKFIQDFLLGVDKAKENAKTDRAASKWIDSLKRRNGIGRFIAKVTGGDILPNTTVGATTYEIARVAQITGIDLSDAYDALKLISKYYMLGFFIYDPDTGHVSTIFDGDRNYSETSIRNMKSKSGKDMDALSFTDIMKIMGKMGG